LYHTRHWRSAASYVALTRQRESAQVFVARETARDAVQLARQMARGEIKAASVAWATLEDLTPEQRAASRHDPPDQTEAQARRTRRSEATDAPRASEAPLRQSAVARRLGAAPAPMVEPSPREAPAAPDILLPGHVDPGGRDSLGRGLDDGSIAAAVA